MKKLILALTATAAAVLLWAASADAYVYWTNYTNGTIGRANLDGSGVNEGFISGVSSPPYSLDNIEVDSDHIYWAEETSIGRANLDGSGADRSFISGLSNVLGSLAVDSDHVYWSESTSVGRANLDGSGVDRSFIQLGPVVSIAVNADHIYLAYCSAYGGCAIARANLDGTGVESFIGGLSFVPDLAVDSDHIYWVGQPYRGDPYITRANLDGTGVETIITTDANALAVDLNHIYWTSVSGRSIARANLDGSGVEAVLDGVDALGIAVDPDPAVGVKDAAAELLVNGPTRSSGTKKSFTVRVSNLGTGPITIDPATDTSAEVTVNGASAGSVELRSTNVKTLDPGARSRFRFQWDYNGTVSAGDSVTYEGTVSVAGDAMPGNDSDSAAVTAR